MQTLWHDLRFGARMLLKQPGFTLIAVLTLALGIGANTAIFSVVNAVLLRVLPYQEPDRLVQIFQRYYPRPGMDRMSVAPANFIDWQAETQSLEACAAYRLTNFNLSGEQSPERVRAAHTSAHLFAVLNVAPLLGRTFQDGEDNPSREAVTVLSHGLWQRRFGGDQAIIGQTIKANSQPYTVVGVMPPGFRFPIGWLNSEVELWVPLVFDSGEKHNRAATTLEVVARLRPGIRLEQAQASLDLLTRRLEQAYPETNKDWGANVFPLTERGVIGYRPLFLFLWLAVGVVLLIACANVANLLLARGMERHKELTIRAALGAPRWRLIRQLMTESMLLSSLGGCLGLLLALWGVDLLATLAPSARLPELQQIGLNLRVLTFSLGLSVITGFLFSLLPAFTLASFSLRDALHEGGRGTSDSPRRNRLKAALVVGELALTLMLLMCAGTVFRSFQKYMNVEPGFVAENVLSMRFALPLERYQQAPQWAAFFERVEEEVKAIPGVVTAAVGSGAPMEGGDDILRYQIAGRPAPNSAKPQVVTGYHRVSPDYFRALGIKLRRGRYLNAADADGAPRVALVNEAFVRREFPDQNPIGEKITLLGDVNRSAREEGGQPLVEIVGVVAEIKDYSFYQTAPPAIYVPVRQDPQRTMSLLVKTAADPASLLPEIRRRLLKLDPDQPAFNIRTLEQIVSDNHALLRFNTLLLAVFAALALVLSVIGIYGVIAYAVSQRTKEFGIRLALGAHPRDIFKLVLRKGLGLSLAGVALGVAAAFPALKLLARALKASMNLDLIGSGPLLFVAVCSALMLVALLACFIPARRATKVDPMIALRCE